MKLMFGCWLLFILGSMLGSPSANAQCYPEQMAKLLPGDGAAGDWFGSSVATSGDIAVVVAPRDDVNGELSGSAYVFDTRTGEQVFKLVPNDGYVQQAFGSSVDIYETTAIIGAEGDNLVTGAAYLFDTTSGQQITKLLAEDGSPEDQLGRSVSIYANTAIGGAPFDNDNGEDSGSAYLFDITTGQQITKLLPDDGAALDFFGLSVSISGTTAIIGARGDDDNGDSSGSAYLFDTTTGQQIAKLLPDDGAAGDNFGRVAISGNTAIIGAPGDDDNGDGAGSAYLFDTTTGQQLHKLLPDDGAQGDRFGDSVAINGTTAIIAAPGDDDNGPESGSAYLFDTTTGQLIAKLRSDDGVPGDLFGGVPANNHRAVGINGPMVVIGAFFDDDNGENSGSAYLFDISLLICPVGFEYPNGLPILVNSGGGTTMRVMAVNDGGEPQPNTGQLHVDSGNGFETFPMNEVSANVYDAVFPSSGCATLLRYYVSAENNEGERFFDPPDAPARFYSTISASDQGTVVFADDFEDDLGWTVTGDAADGHWQRGIPAGDGSGGDPLMDGDGSGSCYLTDNVAGNSDVDDGSTVLESPVFDGSGGADAVISYYRWYSNSYFISSAEQDIFVVEISNDGGSSWVNLETVGPAGPEVYGGWNFKSFLVSDFVEPTDQMRIRFIASDTDPQSRVEAGVDGVEVRFIECSEPDIVFPNSLTVTRGTYVSGGVPDLAASDNLDLSVRRSTADIQSRTEFIVNAFSPMASPASLDVTLEGAVFARSQVNQSIELFDYVAGTWEPVDTRVAARLVDATVTIAATGDLSRFVQQNTLTMAARIRYQSTNPRQQFSSNTDQFIWTIGQ